MRLEALKRRVYAALRDSEKAFIDDQYVEDWLNDAYLDLCARLRKPEATATGTTDANGEITLPTDFIEPKRLFVGGTRITWTDPDVYTSYSYPGADPGVTIYRIWDDTIETYPAQASTAYVLEYTAKPTIMEDNGDSPSDLPEELHIRLVYYAQAQAKYVEAEITEGNLLMAQYERGLSDLPRAGQRSVGGPIALIPDRNIVQGEWV